MHELKGKTVFITGASRGIGKAIAIKAAQEGANIVIASKTSEPHPKLEGTIHETAAAVLAAGGQALPVVVDIRFEEQIQEAVKTAVDTFGGIDILVNNASAISLTDTPNTPIKRFDLMYQINTRGTFLCVQTCLPYLSKSSNPHILMLSPPLNLNPLYFKDHSAYTLSKFGMSMCVLGMSAEFAPLGIAVNALWPKTLIATAAMKAIFQDPVTIESLQKQMRKPEIVADAFYAIVKQDSKTCTGNFFIDEEILKDTGITDLTPYAVDPGCTNFLSDLFTS